jgi:hypothetical protein
MAQQKTAACEGYGNLRAARAHFDGDQHCNRVSERAHAGVFQSIGREPQKVALLAFRSAMCISTAAHT